MDMKERVTISHDVVFDEETMGKLSSRRYGLTYQSTPVEFLDAKSLVEGIPAFVPRRSARTAAAAPSPAPTSINTEVALR